MRPRHRLTELPERTDARGTLTFAQDGDQIPFPIKRFFLLYAIPAGNSRGGHAHRKQHQLLLMTSGAATITVDDGYDRTVVRLDKPTQILHVPPMLWLDLDGFTPGATCLVHASDRYSEDDYIRERDEFLRLTRG